VSLATSAIGARAHGQRQNNRPLPSDFADLAATGLSIVALRKHYAVGTFVVNRWIEQIGGKARAKRDLPPRAMPDDFPVHAARETVDLLMRRYECGTAAIARWRREALASGALTKEPRQIKPLPGGFALIAPGLTEREMRERYGISKPTVRKWCAAAGVVPLRARRTAPPPSLGAMGRPKAAPMSQNRDTSRAGMAADYLRRFGPVIRCKADGHFDPAGSHWRRGSTILTAEEIVARAIRNGFDPDGWRCVA
jgi:hypothetical protein